MERLKSVGAGRPQNPNTMDVTIHIPVLELLVPLLAQLNSKLDKALAQPAQLQALIDKAQTTASTLTESAGNLQETVEQNTPTEEGAT